MLRTMLQLAVLCHVPKALQEATPTFSIKEWAEAVAKAGNAKVRRMGLVSVCVDTESSWVHASVC